MMRTEDCVVEWVESMLHGGIVKKGLKANSCHADGNFFISYSTPVARFVDGKFEVATRKYSCTTSKLQGYLRRNIPHDMKKDVFEIVR